MGRILIVFDTKGGSTREIIQWIKEGASSKGAHVDVKTPGAVTSLDYDLIVVGTPIYNEKPMKSVRDFLKRGDLRNKNVALFVVCFGGVFGMANLNGEKISRRPQAGMRRKRGRADFVRQRLRAVAQGQSHDMHRLW